MGGETVGCTAVVAGAAADLDARAVGEEGLWALGVVQRAVAHAAPRRADGQVAAVEQVPRAVAVLSGLVHNLVEERRKQKNKGEINPYLACFTLIQQDPPLFKIFPLLLNHL